MRCPYCAIEDSRVIDTREVGAEIRRRRECPACGRRFTTYERVAPAGVLVVKRDGRREEFDREKVLEGMRKACTKRAIPVQTLEEVATEVETAIYDLGGREVPSSLIGEMVMERLKALDEVAYVRFASVYRRFADVESLAREIEALRQGKKEAGSV